MKRNWRQNRDIKIRKDISGLADELKTVEQSLEEVKSLLRILAVNELRDEIDTEEKD